MHHFLLWFLLFLSWLSSFPTLLPWLYFLCPKSYQSCIFIVSSLTIWNLFCEWSNKRDLIYLLMIASFQNHLLTDPFLPSQVVSSPCYTHIPMKVYVFSSPLVWHQTVSLITALEEIWKSFKVHPLLFNFGGKK